MVLAHTKVFGVHNTHSSILRSPDKMASSRSYRGLQASLDLPPVDKLSSYSILRPKQLPVVKNKPSTLSFMMGTVTIYCQRKHFEVYFPPRVRPVAIIVVKK